MLGSLLGGLTNFITPGVGELISGMLGMGGQHMANQTNIQEAALNRQFQADQAAKMMRFQRHSAKRAMSFSERMSSTQHQRQMADLRKAGLNPILSAKLGGASAPAGVMASGAKGSGAQARVENIATPGVTAYQQHRLMRANVQLAEAKATEAQASARDKDASVDQRVADTQRLYADTYLKDANRNESLERAKNLVEQRKLIKEQTLTEVVNRESIEGKIMLMATQVGLTRMQARRVAVELPRLMRMEDIWTHSGAAGMMAFLAVMKEAGVPDFAKLGIDGLVKLVDTISKVIPMIKGVRTVTSIFGSNTRRVIVKQTN